MVTRVYLTEAVPHGSFSNAHEYAILATLQGGSVGNQGLPVGPAGPGPGCSTPELLQLRLTEYEALMTRNSYLLQVQYAFWSVALVILAVAAQVWSSDKAHGWLLAWSTLISLMLIAIVWGDTLCDLFGNVTYIEHALIPRISSLVGSKEFWLYEPYLYVKRRNQRIGAELTSPVLASVLSAVLIVKAWPLAPYEWCAVVLSPFS